MYRIGLDLRPTEEGFKAHCGRGTGRYATQLAEQFLGSKHNTGPFEIIPFFRESAKAGKLSSFVLQNSPVGKVTFETQFLLPSQMNKMGVDLFHFFSHGDAPARSSIPYVVTVLDLIPLRFPDLYRANKPTWRYRLARFLEHQAIRKACGIIAISDATKRDLIEFFQLEPECIQVTPLAVSEDFRSRDLSDDSWELDMVSQRAHFQLPLQQPVLLYVGGIDPRKNIGFLLRLFSRIHVKSPASSKPVLVLAGPYESDERYPQLLADIRALGLSDHVRLLGFLSDTLLRRIYHASNVFVFPSLYEGFGLPVLEAMSCGVPVICGQNSSLPEITGESAVSLRDNDEELWTKELLALLSNPNRQHQLALKGVEQAKRFSWKNTARQTLQAYAYFLEKMGKGSGVIADRYFAIPPDRTASQETEKHRVALPI